MSAHVLDRLSMYLDGELAAAARAEVEAHLRGCAACARHLGELAAVDAAARELPVPAPAGYFDSLPARVRARLPARRSRRPPAWVWAAAAGLALAALTPLALHRTTSPVPEAARTDEAAGLAPPPTRPASAPAEEARGGHERAKALQAPKDAVLKKPATPRAATAPSLFNEPARENAAPAPPPAGQVQKHAGPWAQAPPAAPAPASRAPQAASRAEQARAVEALADEVKKEAAPEGKLQRDQARLGGLAAATTTDARASDEAARFRALLERRPASAAEERQLHDAWRAFAEAYPASPRADEARVRAIAALAHAWSKSGDDADRARAREAALDYLAAPEAPQRERVRALLESLTPPRP